MNGSEGFQFYFLFFLATLIITISIKSEANERNKERENKKKKIHWKLMMKKKRGISMVFFLSSSSSFSSSSSSIDFRTMMSNFQFYLNDLFLERGKTQFITNKNWKSKHINIYFRWSIVEKKELKRTKKKIHFHLIFWMRFSKIYVDFPI